MMLYEREQPEAGPSRPLNTDSLRRQRVNTLSSNVESIHRDRRGVSLSQNLNRFDADMWKRQEGQASSSMSIDSASSSSNGLAAAPTASSSDASSGMSSIPATSQPTAIFGTDTAAYNVSSTSQPAGNYTASTTTLSYSSTFSRPWEPSTRSTSSHPPQSTPYVPGVILPLTLDGDDDDQAVYSVPMTLGHSSSASNRRKRRPSAWNGGDPQTVNLQVDLGSSDMWVASTDCTTSDCLSAPALYNASQSLDSGFNMTFQYQAGTASGEVYWEQALLGGFGIGYQALLAADQVTNEDLGGGNFTGVLGLALPANSIILSQIAGSTSGAPDGATFLDNLFGSGAFAPTQRLFSLSLARREDVRTSSTLGIGAISEAYCPTASCKPKYLPIIPQPSLGLTGYLHWRLPLQGIIATTFANQQTGQGVTTQNITLGPSQVDNSRNTPLAVLDSGGVAILAGYKPWVDSIYAAFGVSASSDGLYRMPCTQQIALSFVFGGETYAAHPLDMTWADPKDPSQQTCIGAIQYSSSLGKAGDFILGSSFLKNVYSIFQYPDNLGRGTWQPTVGLVSVTNASVASEDFYAVRVLGQSLADVSSNHNTGVGASNPAATSTSHSNTGGLAGKKVLSTAGIAGVSVAALFLFAAGIFCAWWFWLRRRLGKNGKVIYPQLTKDENESTLASSRRTKKHNAAQRQKSMIEGYSDYEDSWMSGTEGGESIRLGYIPEVVDEDDPLAVAGRISSRASSARESSPKRQSVATDATGEENLEESRDEVNPFDTPVGAIPLKTRRGSSVSRMSISGEPEPSPSRYPYLTSSWSMAGPFPSPQRASVARPDSSPMYDIRSSDYFTVDPSTTREGRRMSASTAYGRRESGAGTRGRSPGRALSGALLEESLEGGVEGLRG